MQNNGNWKCFQMKDQGVYYGEIAFVKTSGEVITEDHAVGEDKNSLTKIRHGQGVQLFPTTSQDILCKYEGDWLKDKRHGKGVCYYPNGDTYSGEFQNDKRHGLGVYLWQNGKKFEGEWKADRMDGKGTFTHASGFELSGEFKANYYIYQDFIVNPFIEGDVFKEEVRLQEEYRKKNSKILETQQKIVKIHRIPSPAELLATVQNIDKTNRVAVIISSIQSYIRKSDILRSLPGNTKEVDLRYLVSLKKSGGREKTREYLREMCLDVFTSGGCLFLNLDDSSVKYDELYYPDLQEFFYPVSFPATLFRPNVMKRAEVWNSFCNGENFSLNSDYLFVIWSKTKFDEGLDDQDLLAKFEKKFSKVFCLDTVDMVFCNNQIEEENSYREQ